MTMKLYHVSTEEIRTPDIYYGRKNADFGQGFYLSPDKEFSYRWASENAVLNCYTLNTDSLTVRHFSRDIIWYEYIFNNRSFKDTMDVDVIIGPIANDTIYNTFGILTSGFIKKEDAVNLFSVEPQYIQVAIKSENAVKQLEWTSSERITNTSQYKEIVKSEEEEYQRALAEYMQNSAFV